MDNERPYITRWSTSDKSSQPVHIRELKKDIGICSRCKNELKGDQIIIQLDNNMEAIIYGKSCVECKTFYVKKQPNTVYFFKDNPRAKGFTFNGIEASNYTKIKKAQKERSKKQQEEEKKKRELEQAKREEEELLLYERKNKLSQVNSAEVMISIVFEDQSIQDFIIVNDRRASNSNEILHYSSDTALELLSATYARQRHHRGTLNGRAYKLNGKPLYPSPKYAEGKLGLPEEILPTRLVIRKDGGYISSITHRGVELVDALLYSLKTQRYEVMHVTYSKSENLCYADINRYRSFIHKNGRTALEPQFTYKTRNGTFDFGTLNAESILKIYGYTVSESEDLTICTRHDILAEVVDLEILTVRQVVDYIDFFIRMHPDEKYLSAQMKWESDKEFIQNYKVNPSRFLIAKDKK